MAGINPRVLDALTPIAVACAVIMTVVTVRNATIRGNGGKAHDQVPTPVADWRNYLDGGHWIGSPGAPVKIIEFADYECPVCGTFERGALRSILAEFPSQVAVLFRNWPLSYHRFAYPTARAAECAGEQGRFREFHDLVFQEQDSLGLKPFQRFAQESGVPDTSSFGKCIARQSKVPSIEADMAAASKLGGTGTPTIVINGLRLPGAPDSTRLEQLVEAALRERPKGS
jgi:protein-disulfide isomerase